MGIAGNKWGFTVGRLPHGPLDKISDVPGVTVGHCTLAEGNIQTGVTALLPHQGDVFHDKLLAASYVINGFGKTTGLVQIDELGTLETPILFTNTLSVGTVETALVKYMLVRNPDICETTGSVNPVVCECNDSGLNDIRGLHVTEEHVFAALADCKSDFAEFYNMVKQLIVWIRNTVKVKTRTKFVIAVVGSHTLNAVFTAIVN